MSIVRDLDDLKARVAAGHTSYGILLAGGAARSSKTIHHVPEAPKPWDVWNGIDDTWQQLTDEQLDTDTHIGEALRCGALVDDDGPLPSPYLGGGPGEPAPFDAYEVQDVAEYESHGYYFCEPLMEAPKHPTGERLDYHDFVSSKYDDGTDTGFCDVCVEDERATEHAEPAPRIEKVMVSLYGHFATGGVHCITDHEYDPDLKDSRAEAIDYIMRLAHSIADGKPVHDLTYAEEEA